MNAREKYTILVVLMAYRSGILSGMIKNRIKELRSLRGWTQDFLAEKAGVTPIQVYRVESGERSLTWDSIPKYMEAFKCSIHDLIDDETPNRPRLIHKNSYTESVPFKESLLQHVLEKFLELANEAPDVFKKYSREDLAKILIAAYLAGHEEEEELGKEAEISKASIRSKLRLYNVGNPR